MFYIQSLEKIPFKEYFEQNYEIAPNEQGLPWLQKFFKRWYIKITSDKKQNTSLNGQNLLGHNRQYFKVNTVELIKAGPSTTGGQTLQKNFNQFQCLYI